MALFVDAQPEEQRANQRIHAHQQAAGTEVTGIEPGIVAVVYAAVLQAGAQVERQAERVEVAATYLTHSLLYGFLVYYPKRQPSVLK